MKRERKPEMMRGLAVIALAMLAGCGGNGETPDNQDAGIANVGAPDPSPDIPARFTGTWDQDAASCSAAASDMRLTIAARQLQFYDGSARVASVTKGEDDSVKVNAVLDSEGITREEQFTLTLGDDGRLTVRANGGEDVRVRCSATNGGKGANGQATVTPLLNIAPDSIALVDPQSGRTRRVQFGTQASDALDAVGRAAGEPVERGTNRECESGPLDFARFDDGLTLLVKDGDFVGWSLQAPSKVSTMSGVGIGSTRKQFASSYKVENVANSEGREVKAGAMHALLSGDGAQAKIARLWAGASCHFP
ncbi:hypothetical protein KY084_11130 [Stakelama sp. CBK3Z-3]|uniref:Lipoprotein n=1 Tax=Stakelama flava TaxID=2860338 RepID=A0ABS6XMH9_9SPHN|nr:hypothetical protein [Stakelama flava]MBW4331418.1 hypothetical protein [Stakelama flava]